MRLCISQFIGQLTRQWVIGLVGIGFGLILSVEGRSEEYQPIVYNIHHALDLGLPGESPQKDYYLNLGSSQGVSKGSSLEILRRISTYDSVNERPHREVAFPIAVVKVIHVEPNASIARLEKWLPAGDTPAISPRAILLGDWVRLTK